MTQKVNPSISRPIEAFKTAGDIYYNSSKDNFIVNPNTPTEISSQDIDINEGSFTAFGIQSSTSSFDITIEPGEAFVFGSWLAKDTNTTVTMPSNTTDETVYVGWDRSESDDVIIGPDDGRFATSGGDSDQKVELYDVTTDGSGVTNVTNLRDIGGFSRDKGFIGDDTLVAGDDLRIASDEYMVVGGSYTINGDADIQGDLVTVPNTYSHNQLADVDPTDHLEVVKEAQVTLSTQANIAFDGVINNVSSNQTEAYDVTVAPTSGTNDDYAFNYDTGRKWNNGKWHIPVTVNWDEAPSSSGITATIRIHRRT